MARRRERHHHRERPGGLHGRAVHLARQPRTRWSSRASCGAACSSRRPRSRTTPASPTGHHGPRADAEVPRPGRALRHALHHRPGDRGRARRRARRDPQGPRRRRRLQGAHGDPLDGRRAQEARRPRRGRARRRAASPTAPRATRRSSRTSAIMVVGGGDSAMEEAMFLAKFGSQGRRRPPARRVPRLEDHVESRARAMENIEFQTPYVVEAFLDGDGPFKRIARLRNAETGETRGRRDRRRVHRDRPRAAVARSSTASIDGRRRGLRQGRRPLDADQPARRLRRRRPRRPHLPPGDHRRRLGLPGRAGRRVVPARHAARSRRRRRCPRATWPRRSGRRRPPRPPRGLLASRIRALVFPPDPGVRSALLRRRKGHLCQPRMRSLVQWVPSRRPLVGCAASSVR